MILDSLRVLAGLVFPTDLEIESRYQEAQGPLERFVNINAVPGMNFEDFPDPVKLKDGEIQGFLNKLKGEYARSVGREDRELGVLLGKIGVKYGVGAKYKEEVIEKIIEDREFFEAHNVNVKFDGMDCDFSTFMEQIEERKGKPLQKGSGKNLPNMAVPYSLVNVGKGRIEDVYVFPGIIRFLRNKTFCRARNGKERNELFSSYLGHEFYHVLLNSEGFSYEGKKITLSNSNFIGVEERDFQGLFKLVNEYNAYVYQLRNLKNDRLRGVVDSQLRPWKIGIGNLSASNPKIRKLLLEKD